MSDITISRQFMIQAGQRIQERVHELKDRARLLFYAVMLFQRECASCGNTTLVMTQDNRCRCSVCGVELDPTLQFQTCPDCEQSLILKVRHYWCPHCQQPVHSRFCFDEKVFDAAYFRDMMRESRDRKQQEVEKLRELLHNARSPPFWPENEPEIDDPIQFAQALEGFLAILPTDQAVNKPPARPRYDTNAYRAHILQRVQGCTVQFEGISALVADRQLDRIYRFITAVFLDHEGLLEIEQYHDGRITLVGS